MSGLVIGLTPVPVVLVANTAVGGPRAPLAAEILPGLMGGLVCLFGALDLSGAQLLAPGLGEVSRRALDGSVIAIGFVAAAVAAKPLRLRIARVIPIDPTSPVHALALSLAAILVGFNLAVVVFTDTVAAAASAPPVTIGDLLAGEIPFLILAATGVGIFIRRAPREAATRLGLEVPRWWHVSLALAAAGLLAAVAEGAALVGQALTPSLAQRIVDSSQHAYGPISASALGVVAIALLPGLCEDILFRGALQPRLGLLATALVFTSLHVQYSLSFDTLAILISALVLGYVRKYTNTTTSALCHAGYNLLASIGLAGAALNGAILVEVVLIAATAYAVWTHRRRLATAKSSPGSP